MKTAHAEYRTTSKDFAKNEKLNLFPKIAVPSQQIRPIHYLGSKLRMLEFIKSTIDQVDPTGVGVCDLFAGSGTVSKYLSGTRSVVSVDIQEYSRVICSALLHSSSRFKDAKGFINTCKSSKHYAQLLWCLEPMIAYEAECINIASLGDPNPLCELIESGSIISFEQEIYVNCSSNLNDVLKSTISRLEKSNFLLGPQALVVRYFGGLYFSYLQAVQIDALLEAITELPPEDRDTFLAGVISTASDIVNTVGKQFAQPLKPRSDDGIPKKNIVNRIKKDRIDEVFLVFNKWADSYLSQEKSKFDHYVYKMDYSDALDVIKDHNDIKVVYADPPYTRYHYSRYYHVLETICLRDNPSISTTFRNGKTTLSRGIYREDRHQSAFSIKTQAATAFDTLFKKVRCLDATFVLSYSPFDNTKKATPRVYSISELEKIARSYFAKVETVSVGQFSHSKLNHSDNNFDISVDAELLIVCQI